MHGALQQRVDLRRCRFVRLRPTGRYRGRTTTRLPSRVDDPVEVLALVFTFDYHPKRSQQPHRRVLLRPLVLAESLEGRLPDSFNVSGPRLGDQRGVRREARQGTSSGSTG